MSTWKSFPLKLKYDVLGWIAFGSWSVSFYPQILLNYRRKSVVGLNFDFALLNFVKQMAYLVYNASVFFSPIVQKQYRSKYGGNEMLPVAPNDVAFSIHAVLLTGYTCFQILIYHRGNQKLSRICLAIIAIIIAVIGICTIIAIPKHAWYWLVSIFNNVQVVMTIAKYVPQVFFNFQRKSTTGFSIGNVLLDLLGGICNMLQMIVQSIDQRSFENLYGNIGKTLLALVSILFDTIFIVQHYLLYRDKKPDPIPETEVTTNVELPRDIESR